MTSAEQLKDICQRFMAHVDNCEQCDLAVDMDDDMKRYGILSIHIATDEGHKPTLCPAGKDLFMDVFAQLLQ